MQASGQESSCWLSECPCYARAGEGGQMTGALFNQSYILASNVSVSVCEFLFTDFLNKNRFFKREQLLQQTKKRTGST